MQSKSEKSTEVSTICNTVYVTFVTDPIKKNNHLSWYYHSKTAASFLLFFDSEFNGLSFALRNEGEEFNENIFHLNSQLNVHMCWLVCRYSFVHSAFIRVWMGFLSFSLEVMHTHTLISLSFFPPPPAESTCRSNSHRWYIKKGKVHQKGWCDLRWPLPSTINERKEGKK